MSNWALSFTSTAFPRSLVIQGHTAASPPTPSDRPSRTRPSIPKICKQEEEKGKRKGENSRQEKLGKEAFLSAKPYIYETAKRKRREREKKKKKRDPPRICIWYRGTHLFCRGALAFNGEGPEGSLEGNALLSRGRVGWMDASEGTQEEIRGLQCFLWMEKLL